MKNTVNQETVLLAHAGGMRLGKLVTTTEMGLLGYRRKRTFYAHTHEQVKMMLQACPMLRNRSFKAVFISNFSILRIWRGGRV